MGINATVPPVYSQIALDVAMRIARGELKENTKVYGRSVMSSEYGVSPETIRRAMKLLEDMQIVQVRQNSGVIIHSADNARRYVERFGVQNDIRAMQKKLRELLRQQQQLGSQISDVAGSIIRINEKFSKNSPFFNYESDIPLDSPLIDRSLGEVKFWQKTRATVIAVRRQDKIILSPGPYMTIKADDTLIYVGDVTCAEIVNDFIKKG